MKISAVGVKVAALPNSYGRGIPPRLKLGVLSIETDEGTSGETFVSGPGASPEVVGQQIASVVRPILLGGNPLDIGRIWHALEARSRALDNTVQGYVDVALWDIAGKVAGLPIHRLLGNVRTTVPAYVSSWHHSTPEEYAEEALAYREQGIGAYKLHPPSCGRVFGEEVRGVTLDIAACSAVRHALGPEAPLFLDAAFSYSYQQAIRVGKTIEELDYLWYEDPLPAHDLHGYTRLKPHLHIPILATEVTVGGPHALPVWIISGATDYLRDDVVIKGGITGLIKIAHLAEAFGMNCEIHDAYNALNNVASLHVAAAIKNCEWFEILTPHPEGQYNFDHLNMGLAEPFVIDGEGRGVVPDRPGLGVEIDWDRLRAAGLQEIS
ncbi:MAG TPA: enolase C-terminal domain-like protein [Candidatus Binataceae bacterium]|jgi:L-alanine-DL-glutamate epimerase-like enolase superfamily enzyme